MPRFAYFLKENLCVFLSSNHHEGGKWIKPGIHDTPVMERLLVAPQMPFIPFILFLPPATSTPDYSPFIFPLILLPCYIMGADPPLGVLHVWLGLDCRHMPLIMMPCPTSNEINFSSIQDNCFTKPDPSTSEKGDNFHCLFSASDRWSGQMFRRLPLEGNWKWALGAFHHHWEPTHQIWRKGVS